MQQAKALKLGWGILLHAPFASEFIAWRDGLSKSLAFPTRLVIVIRKDGRRSYAES
jgi:hypothetical protein